MGEYGDCILTRSGDDLIVQQADPRIRISVELLDEVRSGQYHPKVTLDGDVFTINGSNQKAVYRIGPRHRDVFGAEWYHAEWPD